MIQIAIIATDTVPGRSADEKRGTMSWRKVVLLAFFLTTGVPNAHAQREVELTPFFGTRFGGKIDVSRLAIPNADYFKIKTSENYGILADISVWRKFQAEFVWNRQPTSLTSHNPNNGTYTSLSKMNLDSYLFGVVYRFRNPETKLQPFVGVGFGFSHFGISPVNGQPLLSFTNRYAFNWNGGVKYFFNRHFGIRTEVRWSRTDTTGGAEYCFSYYTYPDCVVVRVANYAKQGQANVGLIFRFK